MFELRRALLLVLFVAVSALLGSDGVASRSLPAAPWVRVTPTTYQVDGGAVVESAQPLAEGLRHARPGSIVEVGPGTYPTLRLGFGRGADNADCSGTAAAPITIRAAYPGARKPVISGAGKSDALMIDQAKAVAHITFEGIEFEPGYRAGVIFYQQKAGAVHRGFRFLDCDIIGKWDHVRAEGEPSKWGMWASRLVDFEWRGVVAPSVVRDIRNEHGFYIQNNAGDVTIENVHATRLGRTFVQFTSRAANGPQGVGKVVVRNCQVTDVSIAAGDAYKGGSAFTVSGNQPKAEYLFEGNTFRAGFAPEVKKLTRKGVPYGTGALVVWAEKESERVGKVTLRNNDFRMAKDSGDRPLVALSATRRIALEGTNRFVAGQFGVALSIDPPRGSGVPAPLPVQRIELAASTQLQGRLEFRGREASASERAGWGLAAD